MLGSSGHHACGMHHRSSVTDNLCGDLSWSLGALSKSNCSCKSCRRTTESSKASTSAEDHEESPQAPAVMQARARPHVGHSSPKLNGSQQL